MDVSNESWEKGRTLLRRYLPTLILAAMLLIPLSSPNASAQANGEEAPSAPEASDLPSLIRPDHPRLFLNREMWPGMRRRALGEGRDAYRRMQLTVRRLPALDEIGTKDWGKELAPAAFVYGMTGDDELLAKIEKMLQASLDHYEAAYAQVETWSDARRLDVSHCHTRIAWLAAFDWVWNRLEPSRRRELASRILATLNRHLELFPRFDNWDGSFYAADNLYWYAGLVCLEKEFGEADYELARKLLDRGYEDHRKMFELRGESRLDDGALRPRLEYTLPSYPHAEWKFFHSWRSAIGHDIPGEWHQAALMPNHAFWNLLPPKQPGELPRHFGLGQAWHNPGYMRPHVWMRAFGGYLAEHIYFFQGSHPEMANLSRRLWQELDYLRAGKYGSIPFWSEIWSPVAREPRVALPEGLPLARHFEGNGTILMRTGSGPEDTYALFNPGGGVDCSPQFDATHFAIYRQGFLALDTGTRQSFPHMQEYYSQSVAHNCVLIRMPGEQFRGMYGRDVGSNAGGQYRKPEAAKTVAFETHPLFCYAASDATGTYRAEKCALMTRQFLFVPPDHFVVFDRVTSTKAEYPKKWLLHTSNEPDISDKTFRADQDDGRLFCRTLYPADAELVKIGGPGKEFWADGKNWPLTDDWWEKYGRREDRRIPYIMGRWRVEVKPAQLRERDFFLHLIQVSDRTVESMVESELIETDSHIAVTFTVGAREVAVAFDKEGACGGRIRISENGEERLGRDLTQEIMPQSGLALRE